jgi:hypothetical protein
LQKSIHHIARRKKPLIAGIAHVVHGIVEQACATWKEIEVKHPTAELELVVGSIITVREDANRKQYKKERDIAVQVQQQLAAAGVEFDLVKGAGQQLWHGGIETMGALYHLSRLAVYLEKNRNIAGVVSDGPVLPDKLDSAITDVWRGKKESDFPHLVFLKGINSHYLPVDFKAPLWLPFKNEEDKLEEAFFGSSVNLYHELTGLQSQLERAGVTDELEAYQCLNTLYEAASRSIQAQTPIVIW